MSERGSEDRTEIAFVIDSLGSGGAQRQLVELAAAIARRGRFSPRVFVYHEVDFFAGRLAEAGIPLIRVPRAGSWDPVFPLRLARAAAARRVRLLHAFLLNPAFWTLLASRALTAWRPVFIAAERDSNIGKTLKQRALQRLIYRASDAVTANTAWVANEISDKLGVPRSRVSYIPNGIDLVRWDAAAKDQCPLPLDREHFNVALVGGLRLQKRHALLFRSIALLPPELRRRIRVWCVGGSTGGDSESQAVVDALGATGVGDCVLLIPPVSNVSALMARLDAVVLVSSHEGFPNVLLEAQASRLPVLSTCVGDVENLVEDGGSGLLAEPDAPSIAGGLARLAEMPEEQRKRMGERGREIVAERFTIDSVAARYEALYESLLSDRHHGPARSASSDRASR